MRKKERNDVKLKERYCVYVTKEKEVKHV